MNRKNDNGLVRFFYSKFFLLFSFVVLFLIVFVCVRTYLQDYQARRELEKTQDTANELKIKKIQLLDLLQYVKSPAFVEEKARTDFNMIKPGEKVVILPPSSTVNDAYGQKKNDMIILDNTPNYLKWWKLFVE